MRYTKARRAKAYKKNIDNFMEDLRGIRLAYRIKKKGRNVKYQLEEMHSSAKKAVKTSQDIAKQSYCLGHSGPLAKVALSKTIACYIGRLGAVGLCGVCVLADLPLEGRHFHEVFRMRPGNAEARKNFESAIARIRRRNE